MARKTAALMVDTAIESLYNDPPRRGVIVRLFGDEYAAIVAAANSVGAVRPSGRPRVADFIRWAAMKQVESMAREAGK